MSDTVASVPTNNRVSSRITPEEAADSSREYGKSQAKGGVFPAHNLLYATFAEAYNNRKYLGRSGAGTAKVHVLKDHEGRVLCYGLFFGSYTLYTKYCVQVLGLISTEVQAPPAEPVRLSPIEQQFRAWRAASPSERAKFFLPDTEARWNELPQEVRDKIDRTLDD